tara:strand:- start:165 stop:716 length:552 start_codon:yes stop_codon:yes gene_type:complete
MYWRNNMKLSVSKFSKKAIGYIVKSVDADNTKAWALLQVLHEMIKVYDLLALKGRKSNGETMGINGDACDLIWKARKDAGAVESKESVRTYVSKLWKYGIAPAITETKDDYFTDLDKLEALKEQFKSGELSVWKEEKKKGNGGTRSTLSPVDAFTKWFTDMSEANRKKWLGSAKGKKFVEMLK